MQRLARVLGVAVLTILAVAACSSLPANNASPSATFDVNATVQAAVALTVTALSTPPAPSHIPVIVASPTTQPTPSAVVVALATTGAITSDLTASVQQSLNVRFAESPNIRTALVKAELLGHTLRATTNLKAGDPNLSDVMKAFGGWSLECTDNKRNTPTTAIDLVDRDGQLLLHEDVSKFAGICFPSTIAADVPATPAPPPYDTKQATTELRDYLRTEFVATPWYDSIKQIRFRTGVVEVSTNLSETDGAKLGPVCRAVWFWANANGDGAKYKLGTIVLVTLTNVRVIDIATPSSCALG